MINKVDLSGGQPLAIYLHWPFCSQKCPYCDFNSYVSNSIDHKKWEEAYKASLRHYYNLLGPRVVTSVFWGGGTPSLAQSGMIATVLNEIAKLFNLDTEVTLEANPTSVEAEKMSEFKAAGINRVSLGVQSLTQSNLKFLGRKHTVEEAVAAAKVVAQNFDNYSIDLIYALPNQTIQEWITELQEALLIGSKHISLYQLTIEEETMFGRLAAAGKLIPAPDAIAADLYEATQEIMDRHNMPAYEISNHCISGFESKHNLHYWHYGDYIGIGPGAHGRLSTSKQTRIATVEQKNPVEWLRLVEAQGFAYSWEYLIEKEIIAERLMMKMRLSDQMSFTTLSPNMKTAVVEMASMGYLKFSANELNFSTTLKGRLVLNYLVQYMLQAA